MNKGEVGKAANITKGEGTEHVEKLERAIEEFRGCADRKAVFFYEQSIAVSKRELQILYAFIFIALVSAILLSIYLARTIIRPIRSLRKSTEIIAKGNLDYKAGTDAKDELGELSRAFDYMTASLKNTTTSMESLNEEIKERKTGKMFQQYLEALEICC